MKPSLLSTLEHLRSKTFLDTLSDILDKCLHFSLIKIESVSIYKSQATLGIFFSSIVYNFLLKMLSLVLIKNRNSFVYLIWILSNKLDLNQEIHFTILGKDGIIHDVSIKNLVGQMSVGQMLFGKMTLSRGSRDTLR